MIGQQIAATLASAAAMGLVLMSPALSDDRGREIKGQASVIDGDTIEIRGMRIRLWGIDAPESGQRCFSKDDRAWMCGQEAARILATQIDRHTVTCVQVDTDRYSRAVAVCSIGSTDIGERMVSLGLALDYARYSGGEYARAQSEAKAARRGIWSAAMIDPGTYRSCIQNGGRPVACSR